VTRPAVQDPPDPTQGIIVWFRKDLRLADHPALHFALETGAPIFPLFILDDTPGVRPLGGASKWWLDKSLHALASALADRGSRLLLRRGPALEVLSSMARETGASRVVWSRQYDSASRERDTLIKQELKTAGIIADSFAGSLLSEPWQVQTGSGDPYRVFSAYWRSARPKLDLACLPSPARLNSPSDWPQSDDLADWSLHPSNPDWSGGFHCHVPGERGAQKALSQFLDSALEDYGSARDVPSLPGTSRLSPHLHWGEISPRQVASAALSYADLNGQHRSAEKFVSELGWREFNHHLIFHFGDLHQLSYRPEFGNFPWRDDPPALDAWERGRTGYPLVDAGMRELWHTGWMHNRVRMVVASFLIKHLLIDWRKGEQWFWDTLVDADLAQNGCNWQWVAGSGADAAPYFRIFNPVVQGQKFDAQADYVRQWVPEIAGLDDKWIHAPWLAPADALQRAGIVLGDTYPDPIVDHSFARQRALEALTRMKESA
jgi:deoxyribodipyrimidine photo-lyase